MKFRSEYSSVKSPVSLDPALPVVLSGSCFSHNMGFMMRRHLWNAVNATGTLFNPLSVGMALELFLIEKDYTELFEKNIFYKDGSFRSWLFDSSFVSSGKEEMISSFKKRRKILREALAAGQTLIITFGTSLCYFLKDKEKPVGNCHKMPENLFLRRRITIDEISDYWVSLLKELKTVYPDLKVIFTVSPVRHLKDGFEGNARSKAVLLLAIEKICETLRLSRDMRGREDKEWCVYFPAYEILYDDLRDYRFYASDMVHPSEIAVEYLWEKFKETFLNPEGLEFLEKGRKIVTGLLHVPKPDSTGKISGYRLENEKSRLSSLKSNYENLKNKYPHILAFEYPFLNDPGYFG